MLDLNLEHLFIYTDWERQKWRDLFHQRGDDGLKISIGPHGDGRFQTVGDLIRHIFSAEKRYVERLSGPHFLIRALFRLIRVNPCFSLVNKPARTLKNLLRHFRRKIGTNRKNSKSPTPL